MVRYETHTENDTEVLATKLCSQLKPGMVLAFFGGMGMGKTAFVRGLARGLGIKQAVSSPTFALVHDYGGNPPLIHFDMYRITTWEDLYSTGFYDYIDMGSILAVEWSENIENALDDLGTSLVRISITTGKNETDRIIEISGEGIDENFGN